MVKPLTMDEYINNPMGKGSNVIMNRELIKKDLENRFQRMQSNRDPKKRFSHALLFDKNHYYVHIVVPSESERTNTYDVVVRFDVPDSNKGVRNDNNLSRYTLSLFSNIPSFTFTYAHVFHNNNILISDLESKYDDEVFDKAPDVRNPFHSVSYEKSIMYALFYIRDYLGQMISNKKTFQKNAIPWTKGYVNERIRNTDQIMLEYKEAYNETRRKKRKTTSPKREDRYSPKGSATTGVTRRTGIRAPKKGSSGTKKPKRSTRRSR